ncbi:exodeoxyribonuclease V subunit alpha [Halothiobacillus sp. DCM-1]|uniref:exodeoxyribonuclease V subunit alpha n=1 Tax=Halothiobacillus sp. DCM-1 TaxID=3112558 RepID=UPI0032468010
MTAGLQPDLFDPRPAPLEWGEPMLQTLLATWVAQGQLRPVDAQLADWLRRQVPAAPPLLRLLLVLASQQAGAGQVCLARRDLAEWASLLPDRRDLPTDYPHMEDGSTNGRLEKSSRADGVQGVPQRIPETYQVDRRGLSEETTPQSVRAVGFSRCPNDEPRANLPSSAEVLRRLEQAWSSLLASTPALVSAAAEEASTTPFVWDGDFLYLRRFWRLEHTLAERLRGLLGWQMTDAVAPRVRHWLTQLFPTADARTLDQQRACALALGQRLTVIMGGPGTGKTTTVLKLLILLQAMAIQSGEPPLRIALSAPTGKAAARLRESVAGQMAPLLASFQASLTADLPADFNQLAQSLPGTVTTLHRLLGLKPNRPPDFDAGHPLPVDVLVIDEASMIGAGLMAHALAALAPTTRLILLGDAGQLSSVEPGAVLGDIAAAVAGQGYHPITQNWLAACTGVAISPEVRDEVAGTPGLADACLTLRYSHRFGADSALGQLAAAVNAGDAAEALAWFGRGETLSWRSDDAGRHELFALAEAEIAPWLRRAAVGCPAGQPADDWARGLFAAMRQMQILCALRGGAHGVEGVNDSLTGYFARRRVIALPRQDRWFAGRPILVTQNEPALGLANGDVGLILVEPDRGARCAVFYDEGADCVRWLNPQRLPTVETAFALTVHKAQGSEYAHSVLILPPTMTPVLTRELIYTALTRAQQRFTLLAADARGRGVFAEALNRQVRRSGQLAARLATG